MLCRHLGLNGTEEYLPPSPLLPPPPFSPLPPAPPSSPPPPFSPPAPAPGGPQDAVPGAFAAPGSGGADPGLPPEFYTALENNKLIQAIKIYREVTHVGLKEAKDRVEEMTGRRRRR